MEATGGGLQTMHLNSCREMFTQARSQFDQAAFFKELHMLSEARKFVEFARDRKFIGIPAPRSVSHPRYQVGYFRDHSIAIWAEGSGYLVFDDERTYYRDTMENLARCLGCLTIEQRSSCLSRTPGDVDVTVDGIVWNRNGQFVRVA